MTEWKFFKYFHKLRFNFIYSHFDTIKLLSPIFWHLLITDNHFYVPILVTSNSLSLFHFTVFGLSNAWMCNVHIVWKIRRNLWFLPYCRVGCLTNDYQWFGTLVENKMGHGIFLQVVCFAMKLLVRRGDQGGF